MLWMKLLRANLRHLDNQFEGMTAEEFAKALPLNQGR